MSAIAAANANVNATMGMIAVVNLPGAMEIPPTQVLPSVILRRVLMQVVVFGC